MVSLLEIRPVAFRKHLKDQIRDAIRGSIPQIVRMLGEMDASLAVNASELLLYLADYGKSNPYFYFCVVTAYDYRGY